MANAPKLFRVILQVSDLDKASDFYAKLLGDTGRRIPRASRHYIDCGPVILAVVDQSAGGFKAKPLPDSIYFPVKNIEQGHGRAKELKCCPKEKVTGDPAGEACERSR